MASTFSIDGVVSGLKTQDIIQQLMDIERRPLTLLQSRSDNEQSQLKAVQSIKAAVTALQGIVARLTARGGINAKTAATDTSSTSAAVLTATASADALNGSFKVTVSQLATATRIVSAGPIGLAVDRTATLANAGFRINPLTEKDGQPVTFSINGQPISVDSTTTLDDGTANSLIAKINAAGANVTASLIADADGRANNLVQLVSAPGQTIQLGSLADTSNALRVLGLADATIQGYTAANVTSGAVAAGALSTSITINGTTVAIDQSDSSFTSAQNAAFIAQQINNAAGLAVRAVDNGDGTLRLEQTTLGSQQQIVISEAGAATGFTVGTTQNGTDRVVSTTSLGAANVGEQLASARLAVPIAGLDASGNGQFTINGVDIAYRSTDTIGAIVNRINASNAGVTAFYDVVQDRLRITANQTGARAMTLSDVTGNFLAATGVLGATQTLGQNAVFSIDSVNGGQPLSSSSNTVTGYVPGVTLSLKSASATPVTVTVSQDTKATTDLVQSFVDKFNALLDAIETQTKYDPDTRQAAILAGDAGVLDLQRGLRSRASDAALGLGGLYRTLADVGISTGAVGSKVGTTDRLVLDEGKLSAALADSPQAVASVFAALDAVTGPVSGPGNVVSATGTPLGQHESGTYYVKVLDTSGNVEVRFVTTGGREVSKTTGKLTPGVDNSTLVPGLTLRAASSLTVGEDSFSLTVNARGVAVNLNDYLNALLGAGGYFATREDGSAAVTRELKQRMDDMEDRLKVKEDALTKKFAALEAAMARLQTQGSALQSQLARLGQQQQ